MIKKKIVYASYSFYTGLKKVNVKTEKAKLIEWLGRYQKGLVAKIGAYKLKKYQYSDTYLKSVILIAGILLTIFGF